MNRQLPGNQMWNRQATLILLLLLGVSVWIHRAAWIDIWRIGTGRAEQSHILLAPLIAAWLFWLRRSRLRSVNLSPSVCGPALVALGVFASWLGIETDTLVLWHASALVALLGCIVTMTGLRVMRLFGPALAAMVFLVPVPGAIRQAIALPLHTLATELTQTVLEFVGIPVIRDGHVLTIKDTQILVGEACNGLRMVFALSAIVYAFVFSTALRPGVRVLLLVVAPFVALICNVIRLIPTSLIFGYGALEEALGFHDLSGWAMVPVALLAVASLLRLLRWLELPIMSFRLAIR